jgi:hypothetical protein
VHRTLLSTPVSRAHLALYSTYAQGTVSNFLPQYAILKLKLVTSDHEPLVSLHLNFPISSHLLCFIVSALRQREHVLSAFELFHFLFQQREEGQILSTIGRLKSSPGVVHSLIVCKRTDWLSAL